MNTNSLRLETKDDSDIETKAIETALANMTAAFETQKKAANDNEAAFKKRIDDLELQLNRPGAAANDNNKEPTPEAKAFEKLIRKGPEALGEELKSLRVSDSTAGGYLAPDQFNAELDRNVVLFSPVRQVARVLPTGAPAVHWPKRTGGMTATWTGETGDRTETTVTFGQSRYPIYELAAYVDVSNAMLETLSSTLPRFLASNSVKSSDTRKARLSSQARPRLLLSRLGSSQILRSRTRLPAVPAILLRPTRPMR